MKQIKNSSCKLPKGKSLNKLGDPSQVSKHYYRLSNGNTRATYQFKFKDGTLVYAGNSNVGAKGGAWRIYCYRQGHDMVTRGSHSTGDLSPYMINRLRSVFKAIDKDGSGTITTGGAYAGLSQVFPSYSLPNFENTLEAESIKAAGKDKKVSLDEFECIARKLYNIQKVYSEFKQYDKNHDLKMDRKELENALIKFYFKDVAKPGLLQTAALKAKVKGIVDKIIKAHDKNHDAKVSWKEFEMDAFVEEHYNPGAKCQSSKTPLNKHEIGVVDNLIKKFKGSTGKDKEMSHSMWYQITSLLTEQAIDAINGPAKGPPLGCMHKKPSTGKKTTKRTRGRFGSSGGSHWGYTPKPGSGLLGGRTLLRRFLQVSTKERMTVMQALQALHKQADTNHDRKISDHEILDIFQGVREHLSASDFGYFLDMVNKLHGPVNCGKYKDCGKCTMVGNAGLCGWFAESSSRGKYNPFGGYVRKTTGNCKFVDRSLTGGRSSDAYKTVTCSTQCKKKKPTKKAPKKAPKKPTHGKPKRGSK